MRACIAVLSSNSHHAKLSSINIHNIHLQTNHRLLFTFPLMFSKIDPNIITLKPITRNNTNQNEDIPLTICRPNTCHVPISPISSPMIFQDISQIQSILLNRIIKKRFTSIDSEENFQARMF